MLPLPVGDPKGSFGGTRNRTAAHSTQPLALSTQQAALRMQHARPNIRAGVCVCVYSVRVRVCVFVCVRVRVWVCL